MDTLAELLDVAHALELNSVDELQSQERATSLLKRVSRLFRQAAGYRLFTEGAATVRLKVNGGLVRLVDGPVTAVTTVTADDGLPVTYTRDGQDLHVDLASHEFVTVTYEWDPVVPDEVRDAVAAAVARRLSVNKLADTGVKGVSLGADGFTANVQLAPWAINQVSLSPEDRALAESYRSPRTQIIVQQP
ncbi:hypothetical protein B5566_02470 [Mycobacterium sp. MHSD3]|nr:hypothetical protein B5566_02470 [Mycobacterium sp. MHSD3]